MNNLKTFSLIAFMIVLSTAFKMKNHLKMKQATFNVLHSVLLLGDVGQFEVYQKYISSNAFDLASNESSIENLCKTFNQVNKDQMMLNFGRLLKHLGTLKGINEAVILGDMVYTEIKKLGVKTDDNGNTNVLGTDWLDKKEEYMT